MVNRIKNNRSKAPFIINIELTDYCPLSCKQCYKKQDYTYLEWNRFIELINEAGEIGVKKILLSGGEPLSYPYLFEAIKRIKEKDIFVCMSSSGCGLNQKVVQQLENSKMDIIYLSLNGSTKEINQLSRDGYDDVLRAMQYLKEADVTYRINWVARKDNIDDFLNVIALCKEYGAQGIDILVNKPDVHGIIDAPLNSEQLHYLYEIYKQNSEYVQYQSCFYELDKLFLKQKRGFFSGCLAGKASMAVFANGAFSICPHIYSSRKWESIMEFWESYKILKNDGECRLQNRGKCTV